MRCIKPVGFNKLCDKNTSLTPTYFFDPHIIDRVLIAINCNTCSNVVLQSYLKEYEEIQNEIDILNGRKSKKEATTDYGRVILVPTIKKARLDELYKKRKIVTDFKCRNPDCEINGSESYEKPDNSGKYINERALDHEVYTVFAIGQKGRDRAILKLHKPCWEQLQRKLGLGLVFTTMQPITQFT